MRASRVHLEGKLDEIDGRGIRLPKNGANNNATKSIVPGTRVAGMSSRKWSSANSSISRWEAVQEAVSTGVNRVFTSQTT